MSRRAFTLVETLAAVMLLGILAAAATPLLMRLAQGQSGVASRWQAMRALQELPAATRVAVQDGQLHPMPRHDGWWIQDRLLVRADGLGDAVDQAGAPALGHRWHLIALYRDASGTGTPLAELAQVEVTPPAAKAPASPAPGTPAPGAQAPAGPPPQHGAP